MSKTSEVAWDGAQVLAASMDPMAVIDGDQHVAVNQPYADLYGFSHPDELAGEALDRRLALDDLDRFQQEILPTCREDGQWRGTVRGRRRDGSTVSQEVSIARLDDGHFVCTVRETGNEEPNERDIDSYGRLMEHVFDAVDDIVYVLDEDGGTVLWNEKLLQTTGYTDTEIEAMDAEEFVAPEQHEHVPGLFEDIEELGDQRVDLNLVTSDGEHVLHEFRGTTFEDPETGRVYRCGIARDVTDREERERELERQRDALETLDRINELLIEITGDLFESATREEIEQTVCDRLAASDLYQFAWIGEPNPDDRQIVPRASAGIDDGYVETVTIATMGSETSQGLGGRALHTGNVQVGQDVRSDPTFEPWRDEALDLGIKSAAAIPLVHADTTYGILAVYATRPLAFSQREQTGFETLGRAVGFAINAIENRNLLFADTVVELEFEVTDPGLVFVRVAEQLACELTIEGYVESASGNWSVYVSLDGASPSAVRDIAADDSTVDRVTVVAAEDDTALFEFVMRGDALNELTESGAILTSGSVDARRGRFCIEVPRSADVRQLTDRLKSAYPNSKLVAQREFDRSVKTAVDMRQSIEDRLTDRRQEALTRAYHAGYFDWPRRCTAGDIARSMDISETTFHYHLRNALDTLLAAFTDPRNP